MKKRLLTAVVALSVIITSVLTFSRAVDTPYLTAVNNTLLPLRDSTMPFYSGGVLYVPCNIFSEFSIFASSSVEPGMVRLYRGGKYVDFYLESGLTVDQDGNAREGVPAHVRGSTFFLPLSTVCSYFNLQYNIIPYDPIEIVRIKSTDALNSGRLLNDKTFLSVSNSQLISYSSAYYEASSASPPAESAAPPTPPKVEKPTFEDVIVHFSFYDISAGSVSEILDMLDSRSYRSCFFVSADDVRQNSGLIRRIAGSGHTVGIWLNEGTYEEYLETSALLFEAAKVKTVLISAGAAAESAAAAASEKKLIFWDTSISNPDESVLTADTINSSLPTAPGAHWNLRLDCSGSTLSELPGVIAFLRGNRYTVVTITETTTPVTPGG